MDNIKLIFFVTNNTVQAITTPELLYVIDWSFISCQECLRLKSGELKYKATELKVPVYKGKNFGLFTSRYRWVSLY
jgi:hypothetical protein